jgi:hypothetical protein
MDCEILQLLKATYLSSLASKYSILKIYNIAALTGLPLATDMTTVNVD